VIAGCALALAFLAQDSGAAHASGAGEASGAAQAIVTAKGSGTAQGSSLQPGPQAAAPGSAQRRVLPESERLALARDPATLPRSSSARWARFDPKALRPEDLPTRYHSALAALERRAPIAALSELYALLDEEPGWPPALHQCAVIHFRLQRHTDAVLCARRFLEECPERIGETRVLGHALYSLGRHVEARDHYEAVLRAAPGDVEARRGLALCCARLGDSARAMSLLQEVVAAKPTHAEAWTWIARLALDEEDPQRALVAARRAVELDAFDPAPRFVLAQALQESGEVEESALERARFEQLSNVAARLRRLESDEEYAPDDPDLPRQRAVLHHALGDARRVEQAVRRWLGLADGDLAARLAALDLLPPRAPLAEQVALRAEELAGDDLAAWKRLEALWAARGDQARRLAAGERWRRIERGR
jgi:tetratricopeptide (TPR) repeat protein